MANPASFSNQMYYFVHDAFNGGNQNHAYRYHTMLHVMILASSCPLIGLPMTVFTAAFCLLMIILSPFAIALVCCFHCFDLPTEAVQILMISLLNLFYCLGNIMSLGFLFFFSEIWLVKQNV